MSEFERERDRLVAEIAEVRRTPRLPDPLLAHPSPPYPAQNLAKCVTSVNQLNRNIEAVTTVGAGFEPVQHLWQQFERVMGTSSVVSPFSTLMARGGIPTGRMELMPRVPRIAGDGCQCLSPSG